MPGVVDPPGPAGDLLPLRLGHGRRDGAVHLRLDDREAPLRGADVREDLNSAVGVADASGVAGPRVVGEVRSRLRRHERLVPGPPKRFAQAIGVAFSTTASVLWLAGATGAARLVVAALAVARVWGIPDERAAAAMADFRGVQRRFEYVVHHDDQVYIDDYAHHPEELRMLLSSARSLFPGRKLRVVFQPHLYTRTRDFADGFAASLDLADEVILLDIYPARELPLPGVNSQMILDRMALPNRHLLSREGMLEWVKVSRPELLVTAGAGDIDQLVHPIRDILQTNSAR